jgi:hypothetical protein
MDIDKKYKFNENLLKVSINTNLKEAKNEWTIIKKETKENKDGRCICQHKCKNITYLYNKNNNNIITVGQKCLTKFKMEKNEVIKNNKLIDCLKKIIDKELNKKYVEIINIKEYLEEIRNDLKNMYKKEIQEHLKDTHYLKDIIIELNKLIKDYNIEYLKEVIIEIIEIISNKNNKNIFELLDLKDYCIKNDIHLIDEIDKQIREEIIEIISNKNIFELLDLKDYCIKNDIYLIDEIDKQIREENIEEVKEIINEKVINLEQGITKDYKKISLIVEYNNIKECDYIYNTSYYKTNCLKEYITKLKCDYNYSNLEELIKLINKMITEKDIINSIKDILKETENEKYLDKIEDDENNIFKDSEYILDKLERIKGLYISDLKKIQQSNDMILENIELIKEKTFLCYNYTSLKDENKILDYQKLLAISKNKILDYKKILLEYENKILDYKGRIYKLEIKYAYEITRKNYIYTKKTYENSAIIKTYKHIKDIYTALNITDLDTKCCIFNQFNKRDIIHRVIIYENDKIIKEIGNFIITEDKIKKLNISFKYKDEAKKNGAKWNPYDKFWYIEEKNINKEILDINNKK